MLVDESESESERGVRGERTRGKRRDEGREARRRLTVTSRTSVSPASIGNGVGVTSQGWGFAGFVRTAFAFSSASLDSAAPSSLFDDAEEEEDAAVSDGDDDEASLDGGSSFVASLFSYAKERCNGGASQIVSRIRTKCNGK